MEEEEPPKMGQWRWTSTLIQKSCVTLGKSFPFLWPFFLCQETVHRIHRH